MCFSIVRILMTISKLITEIQQPEQTGQELCYQENKTPFLCSPNPNKGAPLNTPHSLTLHSERGI